MSQILTRAGKLRADNEPVQQGRIYIAPPDFHLLLQERSVRLVRGPRENNHRPAIDPTFRTAAQSYGPRVIGMVLSGALDDGTAGLAAIEKRDGVAVIQDPKMPYFQKCRATLAKPSISIIARGDIAPLLVRLSQESVMVKASSPVPEEMEKESAIEAMEMQTIENDEKPGTPSAFVVRNAAGFYGSCKKGNSYVYVAAWATPLQRKVYLRVAVRSIQRIIVRTICRR